MARVWPSDSSTTVTWPLYDRENKTRGQSKLTKHRFYAHIDDFRNLSLLIDRDLGSWIDVARVDRERQWLNRVRCVT